MSVVKKKIFIMVKRLIQILMFLMIANQAAFSASYNPIPNNVKLPAKYTPEYIETLSEEYGKVAKDQIFHVALDMMKSLRSPSITASILGFSQPVLWSLTNVYGQKT